MTEQIDQPEIPDPEPSGYGPKERAMAGVLLIGAAALAFICLDVLTNGRLTGALDGGAPELPGGDE